MSGLSDVRPGGGTRRRLELVAFTACEFGVGMERVGVDGKRLDC